MTGVSALAHLGVAGLVLAVVMTRPSTPPKPLPVTVMLIPAHPTQAGDSAGPTAPGAPGAPEAAAATAASGAAPVAPALAVPPEVAPEIPPAAPAVALTPAPVKPQPKPKPAPKPKPNKPRVESRPAPPPKPTVALRKPPSKPAATTVPTGRGRTAETTLPAVATPAPGALAGSMATNGAGAAPGAGSGTSLQGGGADSRGKGDSKPLPAYQPEPVYPAFARRLGYEGRVVIQIQVMASGAVGVVNVERSSGYAMLDEAAMATVKRWRFRPAQRGGQPVDATLLVPITFKLQGQG